MKLRMLLMRGVLETCIGVNKIIFNLIAGGMVTKHEKLFTVEEVSLGV